MFVWTKKELFIEKNWHPFGMWNIASNQYGARVFKSKGLKWVNVAAAFFFHISLRFAFRLLISLNLTICTEIRFWQMAQEADINKIINVFFLKQLLTKQKIFGSHLVVKSGPIWIVWTLAEAKKTNKNPTLILKFILSGNK